jgi:hypothetical protein
MGKIARSNIPRRGASVRKTSKAPNDKIQIESQSSLSFAAHDIPTSDIKQGTRVNAHGAVIAHDISQQAKIAFANGEEPSTSVENRNWRVSLLNDDDESVYESDNEENKTRVDQVDLDRDSFPVVSAEDFIVSIDLSSRSLDKCKILMRRLGWSEITNKDWEKTLIERQFPQTTQAERLIDALSRLKFFFLEVPPASDLFQQTRFLQRNGDSLEHIFCNINQVVDHTGKKVLTATRQAKLSKRGHQARLNMTRDLVRLIIPFLVHVLGEAWALGESETGLNFTGTTIPILAKILGWLEALYKYLMRELDTRPLEPEPSSNHVKSRKALEPLLKELRSLLNQAPARLQKKLKGQIHAERRRQISLLKQEEIRRLRTTSADLRKEAWKEQNRKVALALRKERPTARPTPEFFPWRREEEIALCKHLQRAFDHSPPQPPKLSAIAYLLGHSEQDVKHKSQDLLRVMLRMAFPDKTDIDIGSAIDAFVHQWR